MDAKKVFWLGRHATTASWGAPVSKLHKAGLDLLKTLGWEQVPNDTEYLPVFALTTRKGANYAADQVGLPPVRQLPQRNTACLDDKRLLQQHLRDAGCADIMPLSWNSLAEYMLCMQEQRLDAGQDGNTGGEGHTGTACSSSVADMKGTGGAGVLPEAIQGSSSCNSSSRLLNSVFVKHRSGVKGQAVYVAQTWEAVVALQQRLHGSAADFVVQQEVAPPMLLHGRKFVLRLHVLVVLQAGACITKMVVVATGSGNAGAAGACVPSATAHVAGDQQQVRQGVTFVVYAHEDVILCTHACAYVADSSTPAVHISSKGSGHPAPCLLQQLPELHAVLWPQLQHVAARTIQAAEGSLMPAAVDQHAVLYHLFGFDCMADAAGRVVLLEVNSYPAIASGTMSAVDAAVYTRLVKDVVSLLVLPLTDGIPAEAGGFTVCPC